MLLCLSDLAEHSKNLKTAGLGSLPDSTGARMTAVDRYGFDLLATSAEGQQALRLGFGRPLCTTDDVRARMIEMLAEARELDNSVGSRP